MILEVADVRITAGRQAEFEHAAHHGIQTLIAPSKGFRGYKVQRSVESPERYVLLLEWDTVEDHTVGFRGSAAFAQWRALVSDFFTQQPFTEHFEAIPPRPLADAEAGLMTAAHDGPMDKPIQDFSDCHADILRMLDDLTALARPEASTPQRRERASRVLNVFRNVVAAHHREEEAELFSAVLADAVAGDERAKVESLVNRLVGEHRRVEGMYARLVPALSAMASGSEASLDRAAVATLVTDYRAHARFEEKIFLPLAQTILRRNSNHMAALGLALHIRHVSDDVRRRFGSI
jgi:heme-degrading monooxygenase HmoA/hemerythrin-like domain-containing protein